MNGLVSKLLGVVLVLLLAIILIAQVMVAESIQARRSVVAEVTNFIDEITDTGSVTQRQLEDFYLACNSYGPTCDVQILRYKRIVNPDPKNPGQTYTTYVADENINTWNIGDICKVKCTEIGNTGTVFFLYSSLGLRISSINFTLAGRVRI